MSRSSSNAHAIIPKIDQAESILETAEVRAISRQDANNIERWQSAAFELQVPRAWQSPTPINANAGVLGEKTIEWIAGLGCASWQLRRLIDFQSSHYVGIPFPTTNFEQALLISKYLSLWLLWDDVEVENGKNGWRIEVRDVLSNTPPPSSTLYDLGWHALFQQVSETMTTGWLESMIQSMFAWSDAARYQAKLSQRCRQYGRRPTFAESLLTRINTIGMYSTAYLIEYANSTEFPAEFHRNPIVQRMKTLSNVIVGLGNDIFSFAKDYAEKFVNTIAILAAEESIPVTVAFAKIIGLHNATMREFDELERRLPSWGPEWDPAVKQWAQQLRYCSLGFSVWESQAPRYTKMKILVGDRILEPAIVYV
jgi:hypothetical protein